LHEKEIVPPSDSSNIKRKLVFTSPRLPIDVASEDSDDSEHHPYSSVQVTSQAAGAKEQHSGVAGAIITGQDVMEPYWVHVSSETGGRQNCGDIANGDNKWLCPDEFCQSLLDEAVSPLDKHFFWEMIHAGCSFPTLQGHCDSNMAFSSGQGDGTTRSPRITNIMSPVDAVNAEKSSGAGRKVRSFSLRKLFEATELARLFARKECRFLWTADCVDKIPFTVMQAVIKVAFCPNPDARIAGCAENRLRCSADCSA
jgi:hypothetical protein